MSHIIFSDIISSLALLYAPLPGLWTMCACDGFVLSGSISRSIRKEASISLLATESNSSRKDVVYRESRNSSRNPGTPQSRNTSMGICLAAWASWQAVFIIGPVSPYPSGFMMASGLPVVEKIIPCPAPPMSSRWLRMPSKERGGSPPEGTGPGLLQGESTACSFEQSNRPSPDSGTSPGTGFR